MRFNTQFPVAVHTVMVIATRPKGRKATSEGISRSTGSNPVIIRNLFSSLKKAGIITVSAGKCGGTCLAKSPEDITLWDIYTAVQSEETDDIFKFHANVSPRCPVGSNIHQVLLPHFDDAVRALKEELSKVNLQSLLGELNEVIATKESLSEADLAI